MIFPAMTSLAAASMLLVALLNPGKVFPTLHRCAELGRMHIHKGELPFPHLERF